MAGQKLKLWIPIGKEGKSAECFWVEGEQDTKAMVEKMSGFVMTEKGNNDLSLVVNIGMC